MKRYYIQFSTDFHLLSSLSAIENLALSSFVFLGPKTKMSVLLSGKIKADLIVVDPKCPRVSFRDFLTLVVRARHCKDHIIVSPFVFPLFTFLYLLKEGVFVRNIVRTDEGVGSYASIRHYYASLKVENPTRTNFYCAKKALVKKTAVWVTKYLGVCREEYLFNKDLSVNEEGLSRLRENVGIVGRLSGLEDRIIYISQPGVDRGFLSAHEYVSFIRGLGSVSKVGDVVVKKHPADSFDYASYGIEVVEGYPLELYNIKNSVVIGFSSTALLMARIVSGCSNVYFLKTKGVGPFYDGLSSFNKRLFDFYLQSLDV